ncbi:hypothetical protein HDU98_009923 [Podochytrium sp. JEL0797]|nr:hypothetical protein HDU98_009923 [Podochytrium sp. JEL0797]
MIEIITLEDLYPVLNTTISDLPALDPTTTGLEGFQQIYAHTRMQIVEAVLVRWNKTLELFGDVNPAEGIDQGAFHTQNIAKIHRGHLHFLLKELALFEYKAILIIRFHASLIARVNQHNGQRAAGQKELVSNERHPAAVTRRLEESFANEQFVNRRERDRLQAATGLSAFKSDAVTVILTGMTLDTTIKGFGFAISQSIVQKQVRFVPVVVALFNIFNAVAISVFFAVHTRYPLQGFCEPISVLDVLFFHLSMITFSVFILYKTWIVASNSKLFLAFAILATLNRCTWAAYDIITLTAIHSPNFVCRFWSNQTPQIGYLLTTTFLDAGCTFTTFLIGVQYMRCSDLKPLFAVLITENLIRTVFVLAIQTLLVWTAVADLDLVWVQISQTMQAYIFAQIVNAEFWWVGVRRKALPTDFKQDVGGGV